MVTSEQIKALSPTQRQDLVRQLLGTEKNPAIKPSIDGSAIAKLNGWQQAETPTEFALIEGKAPTEFRIFKAGMNESVKGNFLFDEEAATAVMSAWAERKLDLMMDYEHMSLVKPPIIAPASAKKFVPEVRNGELWATQITWCNRAAEMLAEGEIRYFSPAFNFDPETGRIAYLINVALTNNPALNDIRPLMAASASAETEPTKEIAPMKKMACTGCSINLKAPSDDNDGDEAYCSACLSSAKVAGLGHKMLGVLSLSVDMGEASILEKTTAVSKFSAAMLSLTQQATLSGAEGIIKGMIDKAAKHDELAQKFADLEQAKLSNEFNAAVKSKVDGMMMSPAEGQEMIKAVTGKDGKFNKDRVELCTALLSTKTAPIVSTAATVQSEGAVALSSDESKMAIAMGKDPAEYAKWKLEMIKSGTIGA